MSQLDFFFVVIELLFFLIELLTKFIGDTLVVQLLLAGRTYPFKLCIQKFGVLLDFDQMFRFEAELVVELFNLRCIMAGVAVKLLS